jgi:hypothetical protein
MLAADGSAYTVVAKAVIVTFAVAVDDEVYVSAVIGT